MAELKRFEVWAEGYAATGEEAGATRLGVVMAETFKDAIKKVRDASREPALFDLNRGTFWGCRLFDNETAARRRFG